MNPHKRGIIPRLEQLQADQTLKLIRWLTEERITYGQARQRLKSQFGVATSPAALSAFWHDVCVPQQLVAQARKDRDAQTGGRVLLEFQVRLTPEGDISLTVTTPTREEPRPTVAMAIKT